eukprot:1196317-Prorocentrum_minimum.AAC.2
MAGAHQLPRGCSRRGVPTADERPIWPHLPALPSTTSGLHSYGDASQVVPGAALWHQRFRVEERAVCSGRRCDIFRSGVLPIRVCTERRPWSPSGLRERCGVPSGPLLMTALKPMGRSVAELADMAYKFARGGVDLIKDDDGLQNQKWAPFEARVEACVAAVARANQETGGNTLYAPCLNSPSHLLLERARFAKKDACLLYPHLDRMMLTYPHSSPGVDCRPAMWQSVGREYTSNIP